MAYEVEIHFTGFAGTLTLLVEQVRRFEIDILDVRLADVARQVAEEMIKELDLQRFAPFLTVSKLMYVKSRNLLPGQNQFEETELEEAPPEPEEKETEVRAHLQRQYHKFCGVGEYMRALLDENNKRLRAYQSRAGELPEFIDEIAFIEEVTPFDLMLTMNQILHRGLGGDVYRVKVDDAQLLSNRISEVFDFIFSRRGDKVTFEEIAAENPEKPEVVLSFLALVYLVSDGRVIAVQQTPFGPITIVIRETDRRRIDNVVN